MTILVQAFFFVWAACALPEESCKHADSCMASEVDNDLDSEVPSVSLLQSQLEQTRVKVHMHKDNVVDDFDNAKHGSRVRTADARKKMKAEQATQHELKKEKKTIQHVLKKVKKTIQHASKKARRHMQADCSVTEKYSTSGNTYAGAFTKTSECKDACEADGYPKFTYWPTCGNTEGCGCRCASASDQLETVSWSTVDDMKIISGETSCDLCSYACIDCADCSGVERMEDSEGISTYTGLEDGGIMSWEIPDDMTGYCFTVVDTEKVPKPSFIRADGSEIVQMPSNIFTVASWNVWNQVGNELCLTYSGSRGYVPAYRADVDKWTTCTSFLIDEIPAGVKFTFEEGDVASNVYATDKSR